jgi:alkylated DNA repair dioxygenase AlkB
LSEDSWVDQGDLGDGCGVIDFDALWELHPAEFGLVRMFDRIVSTPRWTQSYGRRYWYSGVMHEAEPVPELLKPLLAWANALPCCTAVDGVRGVFDQVLVNWYADGAHYIGPHCDNEAQIRTSSPIVSVSLGAERVFRVRDKGTKQIALDLAMKDRSYVVMGGEMQRRFTHEVPKTKKESGRRINVTFRQFVGARPQADAPKNSAV